MTPAELRPGRADDVPAAVDVFLASFDDLYDRMGLPRPPFPRDAVLATYHHIVETGLLHLAEVDGRVVSIASGIVRGDVWFLSGFWTLPDFQRQGIGDRVLRAVETEAQRRGATTLATWSSLDPGAMGVYLRHGMLPGFPMLTLAGSLTAQPTAPPGVTVVPLAAERAAAIDAVVSLPGRLVDHELWLSDRTGGGHRGWEIVRDGRSLGYVQFDGERVGPAGWLDPGDAETVLAAGLAAVEGVAPGASLRVGIPGANHAALRFALDRGLRLVSYGTFLTSAPFGRLDQYIVSGPLLL